MWAFIFVIVFLLVIYKLKKVYSYWKDRGVDYVCPLIRCFEAFSENIFRTNSSIDIIQEIYNKFPNNRYVGFYNLFEPVLLIRDLELIKTITLKDFNVFNAHSETIPLELDVLWSRNMYALRDQKSWSNDRAHLNRCLTVNKLKASFTLLQTFSDNLIDNLRTNSEGKKMTVEMREIFKRLSNDITAYTYFGVNCDSLKNPDNEFIHMVDKAMALPAMYGFKNVVGKLCPKLLKCAGVKAFSKDVKTFFTNIIMQSIKVRLKEKFANYDVISELLRMHNIEKLDNLDKDTLDNIIAKAFLLVFSGYETVASTLSLLVYQLTLNYDIQRKLYEEITRTLKNFNGTIGYNAIMEIEYLNNVVNETLRLHPPTSIIDRIATKDYTIEAANENERTLLVKKGTPIWILQKAIHIDPKHFPNPTKFDPDRFSNENKRNIKHYSHIPFGAGPRSCPGIIGVC
ncbi:hypothetical protein RI129_007873 [Pyrocoelia pectoralis]|uniref:Cytochrome P450 n=1 Tax=Pyrocoelia pectoralis TaxID=417401 RepID=A0AAN7VEY0_9COLE